MRLASAAILFLVLCVATAGHTAPVPPRDGDLRIAHLFHRAYASQDARTPANVAAFAQVSNGTLWIGSYRGLSTFNGLQWIATTPGRQALDSRSVARLIADEDDALWLGLQDGRVTHISEQAARTFDRNDGVPEGSIIALFRDREGSPWVANRHGIAWFADEQWHRATPAGREFGDIAGAFADRDGALWVLALSGDLYRRPAGSRDFAIITRVHLPPAARASLAQTRDGSVWIAAGNGGVTQVVAPDSMQPKTRSWFKDRSPAILFADRAGHLWMGGEGLQLLNEQAIRGLDPAREPDLDEFDARDGLSGNFVRAIYEDRDGIIWVSTDLGTDRFFHSEFIGFPLPRDLHGTKTLLALENGMLWVADKEAAALIGIRGDRIVERIDGQSFTAATRDAQDRAWFGGPDGVMRIDKDQRHRIPLPQGAEASEIIAMAVDHGGTLWLSAADVGLFTHDRVRWRRASVPGLPDRAPTAMRVDPRGDLWLAYDVDLLFRLGGGQLRRFTSKDGVTGGRVGTMDWEGSRLWLGGDGGLVVMESDRARVVRARNCPAFNAMSGILKTRNGGYWQYHGSILSHVDEPQMKHALKDDPVWVTCETFNFADTLPGSLQVAPSQPLAETTDQRLWFAAGGKLIYKDLTVPLVQVAPPKAMIVDIAERSSRDSDRQFDLFSPVQGMEFPPGNESLSFRFSAWQLWAPERVRFQYRLAGVDPTWKFTQNPWHIAYNNLPPGDYVFEVMAGNGGDLWSDPARFEFSIKPLFHQTGWFHALCGLLSLAIIGLLFQLQLRRVSNRLRARLSERLLERERIARELHDTLLQGFQGLILRFQGLASRLPRDQPARSQLEGLLDEADKVLVESRDRVSELRQSPYESGELPEAIADAAQKLSAGLGIDTSMTVSGTARDIDVGVHAETFLIAREALSNAIRHSGAKSVLVKLDYERHALRLTIRDDGAGIDETVLHAGGKPGHWGIQGMRERASRLKASLLFRRCREGGTEIELRIPASVAFVAHR